MNWLVLAVCLFTFAIVYLEQDYLNLPDTHPLRNTVALQSLLGFAISILLVFRTNTAYDRWWEGRKLWGSLVNTSRNLAIKVNAIFPENDNVRTFFRSSIPFYAKQLMIHLLSEKTRLMLDDIPHPELEIDGTKHIPNQVAKLMYQKAYNQYKQGKITPNDLLLINQELTEFTNICGATERIKNTPIPYSYSAFIKRIVFFYIVSLPFGLSFSLGYLSIPVVAIVFYTLLGMELVAEEIEDPFNNDINDIPMDKIANNIEKHIKEILS